MKKSITLLCALLSISAVNAFSALTADNITWSADSISVSETSATYYLTNGTDLKMNNDSIVIYNGADNSVSNYWSIDNSSSKNFTIDGGSLSITNRLKSGGAGVFDTDGKPASRVMGITVRGACQLQIFALSSSSSETHTLEVGIYNSTQKTITIIGEASVAKSTSDVVRGGGYAQITYIPDKITPVTTDSEGSSDTELLLYSKSGGINFYGVNVVYGEELDASGDSGLATDTYVGSTTFEEGKTSAELTATEILGTVDATEATYVLFTSDSEFTVNVGDEENKALKSTYEYVLLASEFDFTAENASITISGSAGSEVSWTVNTTEYVAPEPEENEDEQAPELGDVVAEYTYDFTTMTTLDGMFIANGGTALVVYFDNETNIASADESYGDGILIYYDKDSEIGKSKYEANAGFDADHSYGLTTLGKSTTTDLYFEVNAPEEYAGNYITVSAEFCAAGDGSRHSIISDELVAGDGAGAGLGNAESTAVGDYQTVTSKSVQISEEGTKLYILSDANLYYFGVTLTISKSGSADDGNGGDGEDTAISSIAIDNVVEVARYNILGQKIETAQKGINIVKYSDGSTQKVLVK